ncbi:MAG: type IVB secretion system protein IcmW [Gammaproteobacteria bacterium]|nr:type IVB secretion system protein IcmW [Gammaproteobacteria bacterium]
MPSFNLKESHQYWKNYDDPMIYRVVSFMESVEDWTVDGEPDIEKALDKLGNRLEDVTKFELAHEENYIQVLCYLKMCRVLRIMQAIDTTHPGSASRLLMYAEENTDSSDDPAGLFLRRNLVFERLRLLGRIFSKERLALVSRAMERRDEK